MNTLQIGVLTLIRSALTQQKLELPVNFNIEDAIPCIYAHSIQTLCYEGAILCGIPNNSKAMQKLFNSYCSAVVLFTKQDQAIEELFGVFEANHIDYLPLKGCRMRPLYPKPELRSMGDADVLIRVEQYEQIVPLVNLLGYTYYSKTDYDYAWTSNELYLELHHRLLPYSDESFAAVNTDGWSVAHKQKGYRWSMSVEDEWLYLFSHFTRHYIAGLGIRHVTDLWVFLSNHPQMDQAYIRNKLSQLDLTEFYNNILHLLSVWFEGTDANEKSDFITDYIFSSGSWGTQENRILSKVVENVDESHSMGRHFLSKLFFVLFPSREYVAMTFPVIKKRRWLYVPLLIVRPIYRLIFERGTLKRWFCVLTSYDKNKLDMKHRQFTYVGLRIKH